MQQVAETFFPLKSSSVQQQLDSARSKSMSKQYLFSLAVPAKNSSDYQLELLWGSEASTYLRKLGEPNQQSLLEVRNVQIQPCMAPDCLPLSISAELVNGGAERITSVKLGVGFSFLDNPPKLDSNVFLSENE